MKHVKKLVLVPIEEWEKVKVKDMNLKEVQVPHQKVMSQDVQKEVKSSVVVRKVQKGMGEKKKKSMKSQIFLYLSPKKRSKGLLLLRHLENNENLQWNKKGEIIYKGKLIQYSNILTLINHTIHDNDTSEPIGMKSFYKVLENGNVPRTLIENKKGKHLMKKIKEQQRDMWRPPGRMNIKKKV